jgi:hypothetical protein
MRANKAAQGEGAWGRRRTLRGAGRNNRGVRLTLLVLPATENAMATKQQDDPPTGTDGASHRQRNAVIGGHVLHGLGQPGGLLRVDVRPLWPDHFRVNVLVGSDAASARVAHSYFLVADGAGNILASTPAVTRRY